MGWTGWRVWQRAGAAIAVLAASTQTQCGTDSCPPGTTRSTSESHFCATALRSGDAASGAGGAGGASGRDAASGAGGTSSQDAGDDRSCITPFACGSDCMQCPAPEHGTATCNGVECGVTCDKDYAVDGSQCSLATIYVSTVGNDDWEGTETRPLRTFRKAMQRAGQQGSAIKTVNFIQGSYSEPLDDFSETIPRGVTVQKLGQEEVYFSADSSRNTRLSFEGDGRLIGIQLLNFTTPLYANTGNQTVSSITIMGPRGPVEVTGNARLRCSGCRLEADSAFEASPYVLVSQHGHLVLDFGSQFDFSRLVDPACARAAIAVTNWASLTLDGTHIYGRFSQGILASIAVPEEWGMDGGLDASTFPNSANRIELRSTTIEPECGSEPAVDIYAALGFDETYPGFLEVEIADSSRFTKTVQLWGLPKSVKIRDSTFAGSTGLSLFATNFDHYDLGTGGDGGTRGNNTFQRPLPDAPENHGLFLNNGKGTVRASGNTWMPGIQRADANGFYPPGTVIEDEPGQNIQADAGRVQL